MALVPDRNTGAASIAVAPDAGSQTRTPSEADSPSPAVSPSPTGTPRTTETPAATAGATSAVAQPSATRAPRASRVPRTTSETVSQPGRIQPKTTYRGVATLYKAGNGDGACLFGPSNDLMIAAMNTTDYESSRACGAYVLVRAANGASVTVRITNECPLPCAPGQLDLSEEAFAKLADRKLGRIPITWHLLSPSTSETISIRYKVGSSPHWCGIQVIGHRNPVARLEVSTPSGWRQLSRTDYNHFLSADGSGCGSAIRITDIYGERLTVNGIAIRPDVVQPTRVQFAQH
ncbi:expansin EXLX1 family cellulose-binding protein [Streptomyces sp. NPDC013953]|uniref:expansin EXLX1 family cellulose-binding protein n=1 Tax=Streptomyces sp. NPDC013953 TaxID=3364868 RepID=UPI0036FAE8E4